MEQLCLKWSNYQSSVSTVFQDLRETEQFTDVTISTTEGNSMRAHRVVLSAASSYFRDILSETNCWQHPVIILKDLPYPDLVSILGEGLAIILISPSSMISSQSLSTLEVSQFPLTTSSLCSRPPSSSAYLAYPPTPQSNPPPLHRRGRVEDQIWVEKFRKRKSTEMLRNHKRMLL